MIIEKLQAIFLTRRFFFSEEDPAIFLLGRIVFGIGAFIVNALQRPRTTQLEQRSLRVQRPQVVVDGN